MTATKAAFGLLVARTMNLGDDIQALAALSHLPAAHHLVDRDDLGAAAVPDRIPIVMNGWWLNYPERLRADRCRIDPLLTSIHIARTGVLSADGTTVVQAMERPRTLAYLRENGPVGCRDHATKALLRAHGVAAHFSGCLTLTLPQRDLASGPDGPVLAVDVPSRLVGLVRRYSDRPVAVGTQWISPRTGVLDRLMAARHRLLQIERAHAVITTRLHVALPSLALGVPVLWVVPTSPDARIDSYRSWVPNTTTEGFEAEIARRSAGWPQNPTEHLGTAVELTRGVHSWVSKRAMLATSPRAPEVICSYAGLTERSLRDWARLDRAARARVRNSRWAAFDRLKHRQRLVGRAGQQGA